MELFSNFRLMLSEKQRLERIQPLVDPWRCSLCHKQNSGTEKKCISCFEPKKCPAYDLPTCGHRTGDRFISPKRSDRRDSYSGKVQPQMNYPKQETVRLNQIHCADRPFSFLSRINLEIPTNSGLRILLSLVVPHKINLQKPPQMEN